MLVHWTIYIEKGGQLIQAKGHARHAIKEDCKLYESTPMLLVSGQR